MCPTGVVVRAEVVSELVFVVVVFSCCLTFTHSVICLSVLLCHSGAHYFRISATTRAGDEVILVSENWVGENPNLFKLLLFDATV